MCSLVAQFSADVLKRSLLVFTGGDLLSAEGLQLSDYLADAPPDLQVVAFSVSWQSLPAMLSADVRPVRLLAIGLRKGSAGCIYVRS